MDFKQIFLAATAAIVLLAVVMNLKRLRSAGVAIRDFYREVNVEMKRVAWPSRQEVITATVVVSVSTAVMMVMLAITDNILGRLVQVVFGVE